MRSKILPKQNWSFAISIIPFKVHILHFIIFLTIKNTNKKAMVIKSKMSPLTLHIQLKKGSQQTLQKF
jgi:hypothetical protein